MIRCLPKLFSRTWSPLCLVLEKAMAPYSCTLAWKIPWMEEPGVLPSMGLHRARHDWSDLAVAAAVSSLAELVKTTNFSTGHAQVFFWKCRGLWLPYGCTEQQLSHFFSITFPHTPHASDLLASLFFIP